jgi:hypothetical protein
MRKAAHTAVTDATPPLLIQGGLGVAVSNRRLARAASVPGTLSEREVYTARTRTCDLGYVRETYVKPRGRIGYRCAAEPVAEYVAKGGDAAATVGLGQVRAVGIEPGLVTSGDGLGSTRAVLGDRDDYSAADVVAHLMSDVPLGVSR